MQVTRKALIKDGWVICSKCGHKLGRVVGSQSPKGLEIKCTSCKEINLVDKCRKWKEPKTKKVVQYKVPHYTHCVEYKESTGTCMARLRALGLGTKSCCKPVGCSKCKGFEPKEEFKANYKDYKENKDNE